jgi:ferritin-like protein
MSIALKGLLTGVFQGIGEAMDEERKQTKELLATRTKECLSKLPQDTKNKSEASEERG